MIFRTFTVILINDRYGNEVMQEGFIIQNVKLKGVLLSNRWIDRSEFFFFFFDMIDMDRFARRFEI